MGLSPVKKMLDTIASTTLVNEKKDLLKEYLNHPLFRRVVAYSYSQGYTFNVNDAVYMEAKEPNDSVESIFEHLDYLRNKGGATNDEKHKLNYLASINKDTVEVVRRIVTKDLRAGFSSKIVESVMKGVVDTVPYQRCSDFALVSRVTFPAIAQKKADGMFAYAMPWKEEKIFTTRQGNEFHLFGCLHEELSDIFGGDTVVIGELQVLDAKREKVLDRKTGNGYLNSFIQGTGDVNIVNRIIYDVWAAVPYSAYQKKFHNAPYSVVFTSLKDKIDSWNKDNYDDDIGPIGVVPFEIVNSLQEAIDFYNFMREGKFEGAILKDFSEVWKDGTSRKFIKLKNRVEAEFEIVDAYLGKEKKKYANQLGGLTVKSADGGILTNVGMGFSDKEREQGIEWWQKHIGKIVTVSFESVIEDKTDRVTKKLYTPAFEETRFNEKSKADTTEYCIRLSDPKKKKRLVKK